MNAIFDRRSIRKYLDKQVEDEKIEQIIKAAMQAPSAANQQPWEFIVVRDKTILDKLSQMSPYSKMVKDADVAVILLGNTEKLIFPENWQLDLAAATQNLLLEAVIMGLGAVWLGVSPVEERVNYIKEIFDLPDNIVPFSLVPIGYPREEKNRYINRFNPHKVHYDKWR